MIVKKLICAVLGHQYVVSNNITAHVHEYRCKCCGEELTDTANGRVEKLTPKYKETNAILAEVYQRKMQRLSSGS